jgi:hypothetical protein
MIIQNLRIVIVIKKMMKAATYYWLMFFKLNFLIILTRPKKEGFPFYLIENQDNIDKMSDLNLYTRVMFFIRIAIILMFFVFGTYVLFSSNLDYIPRNFRVIFAIFILLYGFYRLVSSFQKFKKDREEEI